MKAVVVEIRDEFASVLSDDGCILKTKNQKYEIGQVIQLTKPGMNIMKKLTMISASAAAVLVLGIGSWAYASPYSYVSLDVNPSIEYIVNRFDRVLKINAVNDDGEEILNTIGLKEMKNKNIRAALSETVEQIQEAGYFKNQEEGGIMIATSAPDQDKAEELAVELQNAIEEKIVQSNEAVTVETISVSKTRVNEARELGVTPGKLNLVEKLQESASGEEISIEEWLNKPVKDIMKATQSYSNQKDSKKVENEDTDAGSDTNSGKKNNSDKHQDKDKSDQGYDNRKNKSDKNGKDKSDQNSGNGKDKSDQGSGNGKDKSDKNSGSGKDKSIQGSDNDKDKADKNSGNGKHKADKNSDNGKDKSDKNSGNGKDKSDRGSGNGTRK